MQNIVLLGATGSIGDQTLDIIKRYPDQFKVVGMSAKSNEKKLIKLVNEFKCDKFFLKDKQTGGANQVNKLDDLIRDSSSKVGMPKKKIFKFDHLIVADHGLDSLNLVLEALAMKKRVSIANKELLIAHGEDIVYLAREQQADLIPLDSEHNALFQCLRGENISDVRRLIITASGGPFRDRDPEELKAVSIDQVLNHPNWAMGKKTTVDSATLVNKAFEVIEAHYLFDIPYENIEVRIHPESIVHSIVEFNDGSSKILAYKPDMRFAIGYALFYPDRAPEILSANDTDYYNYDQDLHFKKLEKENFPCFDFVLESAQSSPNSLRQILSNDAQAVDKFINGEIKFTEIYDCLRKDIP